MVGNPEDRFSQNEAHMSLYLGKSGIDKYHSACFKSFKHSISVLLGKNVIQKI